MYCQCSWVGLFLEGVSSRGGFGDSSKTQIPFGNDKEEKRGLEGRGQAKPPGVEFLSSPQERCYVYR